MFEEVYANIFLLARKKSGKTTVMYNVLKKCCDKDTRVVIFSATYKKDANMKAIVKYFKKKGNQIETYSSIFEGKLNILDGILDELGDPETDDEEEVKKRPKRPRKIIKVDDEEEEGDAGGDDGVLNGPQARADHPYEVGHHRAKNASNATWALRLLAWAPGSAAFATLPRPSSEGKRASHKGGGVRGIEEVRVVAAEEGEEQLHLAEQHGPLALVGYSVAILVEVKELYILANLSRHRQVEAVARRTTVAKERRKLAVRQVTVAEPR